MLQCALTLPDSVSPRMPSAERKQIGISNCKSLPADPVLILSASFTYCSFFSSCARTVGLSLPVYQGETEV